MIKRPFLWYAGAYVLGEVLVHYGLKEAALLAVILLAAGNVKWRCGQSRRFLFALPFFFLAGMILMSGSERTLPLDAVFENTGETKLAVKISGRIEKIENRKEEDEWEVRLWLENCRITLFDRENDVYELSGVLVTADGGKGEKFEEGNRILVSGELLAMEEPGNPGQFDSRAYYRAMGFSYMAKGSAFEILSSKKDLLRISLRRLKEWMAENLEKAAGGNLQAGLLRAMVLGEKWAAEEAVVGLYTEAGIGHLLAISGLHVSLAGMSMYRLLRKRMKKSYFLSAFMCIASAFCYVLITGEGTSGKRACLMLAAYGAGQVLGRQYDLASAAAFSALVLLIPSPTLLFQSGFQLSFGSVLALGLMEPEIRKNWKCKGRLAKIMAAASPGIAIQLFTLPTQAVSFYKIPVYSILINLIVLPLFLVIAVSGIAGAFLGGAVPGIMRYLLIPSRILLSFYKRLCEWSLSLPGAVWRTGKPAVWQLFSYGLCLAILYRFLCREREKEKAPDNKRKKRTAAAFVGLCSACVLCLTPVKNRALEIVFLDVGQGDGCLIRTPGGLTFLIDGGSTSKTSPGKYCIEPVLDYMAIGQIDYALVSHGDEDHINGVEELLEKGRIRSLILPKGQEKDQEELGRMKNAAERMRISVQNIGQGEWIQAGDMFLYCLWPKWKNREMGNAGDKADNKTDNKNEVSMTLWLSYKNFDVLFTGDLEGEGEDEALNYIKQWRKENGKVAGSEVEILKVGHHGSKNGSSEAFLDELKPLYGVISCGKSNRYGHPAEEVLDRLKAVGSRILRTDTGGAVMVKTDGITMNITEKK